MRRTRVWVDLDGAGNVEGCGYQLWEFGELLTEWVDPNPDPFARPEEALSATRRRSFGFHGEPRSLF